MVRKNLKTIEQNISGNIVNIEGDFLHTTIGVVVNFNDNCEDITENGVAHLSEHVFLKLIDKIIKDQSDIDLLFMGYTDYTYIVFRFAFENDEIGFEHFIKTLYECVENPEITEAIFLQSKKEVIEECKRNIQKRDESKKKNIFLTNSTIGWLPVGNVDIINSIEIQQIHEYLLKFTNFLNIFVMKQSIEALQKCTDNYIKRIEKCHQLNNIESKIEVYEKQHFNNLLEIFIDVGIDAEIYSFFEKLIIKRIIDMNKEESSEILLKTYRKKFSSTINFGIIRLEGNNMESLCNVNCVFNKPILIDEVLEVKRIYINELLNQKVFNEQFVFDNICSFFIYGDLPIICEKYLNEKIDRIRNISIIDLESVRERAKEYHKVFRGRIS